MTPVRLLLFTWEKTGDSQATRTSTRSHPILTTNSFWAVILGRPEAQVNGRVDRGRDKSREENWSDQKRGSADTIRLRRGARGLRTFRRGFRAPMIRATSTPVLEGWWRPGQH